MGRELPRQATGRKTFFSFMPNSRQKFFICPLLPVPDCRHFGKQSPALFASWQNPLRSSAFLAANGREEIRKDKSAKTGKEISI
jgi:histidine triad (HIT) family protein